MDLRVRGQVGLPRARLLDQLDNSGNVALVLAPAGYGKSTLLAQYSHWLGSPVAAYQADAISGLLGDAARRLVEAIAPDQASTDVDEATSVLEALTEASLRSGGLVLTIDNIEHLIGTPSEHLLARITARRPRNVRIVLASTKPFTLAGLRHELTDGNTVTLADLRFRRWEVERLLDDVYREPLPSADAAALSRRTGGWPAGLAMFHRATRGRSMAERIKTIEYGFERWPMFRQFFDDNVLADVPEQVKEMLERVSFFEVLTADRCSQLLGQPVTADLLESLVRDLALPMTGLGDNYRFEPAFRAHLEVRRHEREGTLDRRQQAADILLAEQSYPEAARALARVGDWTGLHLLLAEFGSAVIRPPVADLIDLVPPNQRDEEPWLIFAQAVDHLNNAKIKAAYLGMHAARDKFTDEAGRAVVQHRLDEVEALASPTPSTGHHWTAWLRVAVGPNAVRNTRTVTELSPAEAEVIRLVGAVFGAGAPDDITRETHRVGIDGHDSPVALLGLRLVRTAIAAARGLASPAALEQIADEADGQGYGWVARLALGTRALGGAPYTAADTDTVAASCLRADDHWGYVLLCSVAALCEVRDGKLDEARLEALRGEATALGAESIAVWAQAFIALARARRRAAAASHDAQAAIDRAEAAEVPGAAVVGLLALSVLNPVRRPSLLRAAATRATEGELPLKTLKFWLATFTATVADARPPAVRIQCFAGFALELNGQPVDLTRVRPRARSALRLLAVQAGRFVHREVLTEALWSDLAPAAATRNLQVTISALRGLLEPHSRRGRAQILVRSGDAYGIVLPPGGYADTAAFTDAVQRWQQQRRTGSFHAELEALTAALSAYGGELLPEEGPAEWAVVARDHFRQLATRVARELAVAELTRGNVAGAIRAAEQCVALDPHDDESWQVLLRGYARSSTPAKAAEARRRYADMLARLGVSSPTGPR